MRAFPDSLAETVSALPEALLSPDGQQAVQKLAGGGYEVRVGLTPEFASTIAAMALEPGIREYCPKDSGERFVDLKSTKHWLLKGRSMFLLLKRSGDDQLSLVGYGWSGSGANQFVPGSETTFALRIGEAGRGQGLAAPFSQLILDASAGLYNAKNIWLETWSSNGAAVHIYHKIGFVTVAEEPSQRQLPDGQTVDDTRIYMSLPNELLPQPS